jgi:hypothetical protein
LAVILALPVIATRLGVVSGTFGSANTLRIEITNWNEVMKVLRGLDQDYVKELRKDFRRLAKEPQKDLRRAIPPKSKPPLSQMRQVHFGRLAWGSSFGKGAKPSQSVLIQTPNTRKKKYREMERIPIVRLQVTSPGTVLFDMAGRRNYTKGRKGMTPIYDYMYTINGQKVPGKRQHRVTPYAFAMGNAKSGHAFRKQASRIIYPTVEKSMPKFTKGMQDKVFEINSKIQRELDRKS